MSIRQLTSLIYELPLIRGLDLTKMSISSSCSANGRPSAIDTTLCKLKLEHCYDFQAINQPNLPVHHIYREENSLAPFGDVGGEIVVARDCM